MDHIAHIQTARLTLRPLTPGDASAVTEGVGNYEVTRWLSVVPYPYTPADAAEFLASEAARPGLTWAICDADGLQGVIGAGREVGYWLARPAWGKGYALEALDAVLDAWFSQPEIEQILSGYFLGNERSGNVLRKAGFRETGPKTLSCRALNQEMDSMGMILTRSDLAAQRRYRLETERLTLRELRPEDWAELARIGGNPDVARNLFSVRSPWRKADVQRWIAHSRYRGRPGFRPAVCLKDGTLIGTLGLGPAWSKPRPSCAYFIAQEHWAKGYATEAMAAFLADTMHRFDLPELDADHFADNPASGAVLRKLGFRRVGEGMGTSAARLEPAPNILYRLKRAQLKAVP